MNNSKDLYNIIVDYKNEHYEDKNYTGFEAYELLIIDYISENIEIYGNFTSSSGVITPNLLITLPQISYFPFRRYYDNIDLFLKDFELSILKGLSFNTPAGIGFLENPLSLASILSEKITSIENPTYELIISVISEEVISFLNSSFLNINTPAGNFISISIQ